MFEWIKEYLYNLFDRYFTYIWDFLKSVLTVIVQYLLDLFTWVFEFVFWVFDSLFTVFYDLAAEFVVMGIESVAPYVPGGLIEAISESYVWLQYINEWVPVKYCISLFIAHYGIATALYGIRCFLSLLPIGRI